MHVILNREPLEEVDCFKYLVSQVELMKDVKKLCGSQMNQGYRAPCARKSVLSNRGLEIMVKKYLYEEVIVPTALCGAEAWSTRSAEGRKLNVF